MRNQSDSLSAFIEMRGQVGRARLNIYDLISEHRRLNEHYIATVDTVDEIAAGEQAWQAFDVLLATPLKTIHEIAELTNYVLSLAVGEPGWIEYIDVLQLLRAIATAAETLVAQSGAGGLTRIEFL